MRRNLLTLLALTASCTLPSCQAQVAEPPPTVPPSPPCPVVSSSGWNLVVEPVGTGDAGRVTVTGDVTLPSRSWRWRWGSFAQLDMAPPSALIEFDAEPTETPVAESATQHVRGAWDASRSLTELTIKCRDTVLAKLRP